MKLPTPYSPARLPEEERRRWIALHKIGSEPRARSGSSRGLRTFSHKQLHRWWEYHKVTCSI